MRNAEVIATDLLIAVREDNESLLECVSDYIACPNEDECVFNGENRTVCTDCKMKWLKKEFE